MRTYILQRIVFRPTAAIPLPPCVKFLSARLMLSPAFNSNPSIVTFLQFIKRRAVPT
jgi:hypothetical protein